MTDKVQSISSINNAQLIKKNANRRNQYNMRSSNLTNPNFDQDSNEFTRDLKNMITATSSSMDKIKSLKKLKKNKNSYTNREFTGQRLDFGEQALSRRNEADNIISIRDNNLIHSETQRNEEESKSMNESYNFTRTEQAQNFVMNATIYDAE